MRYSSETTAPPPDVIRLSREAFAAKGAGLRLVDQGLSHVSFTSQPGFVRVEARRDARGRTEVTVETREHDDEVRRFVGHLPRQSMVGAVLGWIRSKIVPSTRP